MAKSYCIDSGVHGVATKEFQRRSPSGRWKTYKTITEDFDERYYRNCIDSIGFHGDRVSCCYSFYGYIPYRLANTSPDGSERCVLNFKFY